MNNIISSTQVKTWTKGQSDTLCVKWRFLLRKKRISVGKVGNPPAKYKVLPFIFPLIETPGHHLSQANVILVLKDVKDIMTVAKAMKMPDEFAVELSHTEKEEMIEKVASFWLDMKQSWKALKHVLKESREITSVNIACLMEQYNCRGTYQYYIIL